MSEVPEGTDVSETRKGMEMLGFTAEGDEGLFTQSLNVGRVLAAKDGEGGSLYKQVIVEIGRRATKSTSIMATLIGRAMARPGYKAVVTAQSGVIASSIILEHGEMLENNGYAGYKRKTSDDVEGDGTMRLLRNGGREKIEFSNKSVIWCVPPTAAAVRSKAADDVWIDEGGEHEGEKGQSFLDGVRPLMDTRGELAQLILSGTPGIARVGMFWDALEDARKGTDPDDGIVDYSLSDEEYGELDPRPWDDLSEEQQEIERAVWRRIHPGPSSYKPDGSTLTSVRTLERRRAKMPFHQFVREYLCYWPADAMTSAIDMGAWAACERPAVSLPDKWAWAYDVAPDGSAAAVCAAWRDDDGNAWLEVLDYRPGTDWLPKFVQAHRGTQRFGIAYDAINANLDPAAVMEAFKPRVKTNGLHMSKGVVPAQARFVRELNAGRIRHSGQPTLTTALEGARWRESEGGRLFGRKASANDVAPAVAASLALHVYDTDVAKRSTGGGFTGMFD
ncbi:hypothetical protein [Promicromonospora kroppenstedtii]|uniref:hypothetical protein n=1 Tax=Promicromonospora kroppenstedtii TaxID=440482 RepID=UPI000559C0EE|nr:hypothetical protein [Promicromonospora kroppenstedtii]